MARKSAKTLFVCQSCGYESAKWMGRCTECGAWDTFAEEVRRTAAAGSKIMAEKGNRPVPIDAVEIIDEERMPTGIDEFDRVLGGGLVAGTLVLIGGDPGIGKSTIMLQVLHGIASSGRRVLYVSGEESVRQLRLRSRRLKTLSPTLLVVSEIDIDAIMTMVESERPDVYVVDSIQTVFSPEITSAPGSVSQVRESHHAADAHGQAHGHPRLTLVGHVTKDGTIAGPRRSSTRRYGALLRRRTATKPSASCGR